MTDTNPGAMTLTKDQIRVVIATLLHLWDSDHTNPDAPKPLPVETLPDSMDLISTTIECRDRALTDVVKPQIEKEWLAGWKSGLETMEQDIYMWPFHAMVFCRACHKGVATTKAEEEHIAPVIQCACGHRFVNPLVRQ